MDRKWLVMPPLRPLITLPFLSVCLMAISLACNTGDPVRDSRPDSPPKAEAQAVSSDVGTPGPEGREKADASKPASVFSRTTGIASTPKDLQMNVSPPTVTYDQEFEIVIEGLPADYFLPPGSLSLAGLRIDMPGYLGVPGIKPISDKDGKVTFKSRAHVSTPSGVHDLEAAIFDRSGSVALEFYGASLGFSDVAPVANQVITITGSNFSPASAPGGVETHQITGRGRSVISLNGTKLGPPFVEYPVHIDASGNLSAEITMPATESALGANSLEFWFFDSGGRVGVGAVNSPIATAEFEPNNGYPGELSEVHGNGFFASNPEIDVTNKIEVAYRYTVNQGKKSEYHIAVLLGKVVADGDGELSLAFTIPEAARVPSSNEVVFTPTHGDPLVVRHSVPRPNVKVEPSKVYNSDEIQVTVKGLPAGYTLPAGSANLDGIRLPLPGYFGIRGDKPLTDTSGSVTFVTSIPQGSPPGRGTLRLDHPNGSQVSTRVQVLSHRIAVSPRSAVPGQVIEVSSADFGILNGRVSDSGQPSEISGNQDSYVRLNGIKLTKPDVNYPIEIGRQGAFSFELRLPVDGPTLNGGSIEIQITDVLGRTGTGHISMEEPEITIYPADSDRGTTVAISGDGFPANDPKLELKYMIEVDYSGIRVTTAPTNEMGSFQAEFLVPSDAQLGSANQIIVRVADLSIEVAAEHTVPDQYLYLEPEVVPTGGDLMVRGAGFPTYAQVLVQVGHVWVVPPPQVFTDEYGNFDVSVVVPESILPGSHRIIAQVRGESYVTEVAVTP